MNYSVFSASAAALLLALHAPAAGTERSGIEGQVAA